MELVTKTAESSMELVTTTAESSCTTYCRYFSVKPQADMCCYIILTTYTTIKRNINPVKKKVTKVIYL
jgi:hypothetical protein